MANDDDDLFGGFDIPEDVAALPSTAAGELDLLIGAEEAAEDSILAGVKPTFDPEAPAFARFRIGGNTYDVKDKLKALGCRFDGSRRCWVAPNAAVYQQACSVRDAHKPAPKAKRCGTFSAQQQLTPPSTPPVMAPAAPAVAARTKRRERQVITQAEMVPTEQVAEALDGGPDLGDDGEATGFDRDGNPVPKYDTEAEAKEEQKTRARAGQVKDALKRATDDQLADELRARGFEVRAFTLQERLAEAGVDIEATDDLFEELENDES